MVNSTCFKLTARYFGRKEGEKKLFDFYHSFSGSDCLSVLIFLVFIADKSTRQDLTLWRRSGTGSTQNYSRRRKPTMAEIFISIQYLLLLQKVRFQLSGGMVLDIWSEDENLSKFSLSLSISWFNMAQVLNKLFY